MRIDTPPNAKPPTSFTATLLDLLRRPWIIVRLWNWKAAALSLILRVPIFLAASFRGGLAAAASAVLTESAFCAAAAGFYGSIAQLFRLAQPQWLSLLLITVILPALFQALEYVLHWMRGTPHLRLAELISACVSATSALFNWYIMRRDTLLVGQEGGRFATDLARLPGLLLSFITALPRRWIERHKASQSHCPV